MLLCYQDYSPDEERELTPQNHLGLIMIYYLQTMQHIDQLKEYQAKGWRNNFNSVSSIEPCLMHTTASNDILNQVVIRSYFRGSVCKTGRQCLRFAIC